MNIYLKTLLYGCFSTAKLKGYNLRMSPLPLYAHGLVAVVEFSHIKHPIEVSEDTDMEPVTLTLETCNPWRLCNIRKC